ncbi:MAG: LamG domain-containing protein [Candidatus Thorarchaeota archaeon]
MKRRLATATLAALLVLTLASCPAIVVFGDLAAEPIQQMVTAQCIEPPSGVVSWWPGDGNYRDVAGVNPGNPELGTTFAPGMVGQAFSFDGVDDYIWATSIGIDDLHTLTIETWVKIDHLRPWQQRFVTLRGEKAVLRHDGENNMQQLHFYMNFGGPPWLGQADMHHIRVDGVLFEDVWYHVAGTYDGSVMRLYLNGELKGSHAVPGTTFSLNWLELSTEGEPLEGLLDEVTIYNRALDGIEIQAIYDAGSDGKCKPQDIVRYPDYLDFGVVDIGDQKTGIVKVANEGGSPLTIFEASLLSWSCEDLSITMHSDQINDKDSGIFYSMQAGTPGSYYQSFIATATPTVAASIRLKAGGSFPEAGYSTTMRLRSFAWNGPILASVSEFIPGPVSSGHQFDVLFQFPDSVFLTPGETYFIEWIAPIEGASYLSWAASYENPYPEGTAINHQGSPIEGTDFVFATFVQTDVMLPIVISAGDIFEIGITYTPSFIGSCTGEMVIHSDDPGEHVIYVPIYGRSTLVDSGWIEYPVFLDGQISYEDEWSDTIPYEVRPRRAWGWPNKQTEDTDISYYARFKNDDEWLYILYEATWTSSFSSPEAAAIALFFYEGNPNTDADTSYVGLGGGTWDAYGWTGGQWFTDTDTPTGTNDVEGIGYFDGTTYWFEFRKRLDSRDGYDWSFEAGDLMGNRINPSDTPHMLVTLWDSDYSSTYEQNVAIQLSTLTFNANSLNSKMIKFQMLDNVVHLFGFEDVGRPGQPPVILRRNQPLIFGMEWISPGGTPEDVDELRENIIGDPDHKFWMTVDGSDSISLKSWYQEPFYTETHMGPKWEWDHDSDGPGDRDGDGIGDWIGPVLFFRYESFNLEPGTHIFEFVSYFGPGYSLTDTITVIVQ